MYVLFSVRMLVSNMGAQNLDSECAVADDQAVDIVPQKIV